jgi:hypothetical protein
MPTIDITVDRCVRLQQKLRNILLSQADADIESLLDDINAAYSNVLSSSEVNRPQRNKRTASHDADADDTSHANKASKLNRNVDVRNTRNDGRKRRTGNTVVHNSSTINTPDIRGLERREPDRGAETTSTPPLTEPSDPLSHVATRSHASLINEANCYGWDDDSDLSSLTSESDEEEPPMRDTANHQSPRRRTTKTKQKKLQSWEMVDDVRVISESASKLLQLIAGIGDQSNATCLLALKDILSGQSPVPDSPETISLPLLVKQCEQSELMVAESKFKHMVNLMQLSLWLDQ